MNQLILVLHYYIGCLVYDTFNDVVLELTPKAYAGYMENITKDRDLQIRPLLFPLRIITEEQMLRVCKVYNEDVFGDYRFDKWKAFDDGKEDKDWKMYEIHRRKMEDVFNLDAIDGRVMLYEDNQLIPTHNPNYRFEYLKMHFDLFDLIPQKLALDATSFKHQNYNHENYSISL